MSVAFLFILHSRTPAFDSLLELLEENSKSWLVHVDAKNIRNVIPMARPDRFVSHYKTNWGGGNTLRASLFLIEEALTRFDPDYFFLLSQHDFPIKPLSIIEDIAASQNKDYIVFERAVSFPDMTTQHGRHLSMKHFLDIPFLNPRNPEPESIRRAASRFASGLVVRIARRIPAKRTAPLSVFHHGSTWWGMSRKAIDLILNEHYKFPQLLEFLSTARCSEEFFFHTLYRRAGLDREVTLSGVAELQNDYGSHYIDWKRPNPGYPRILSDEDFNRLESSGALFARKFVPGVSDSLLAKVRTSLV